MNGCKIDDHRDIVSGVTSVRYFYNIDVHLLQSMNFEISLAELLQLEYFYNIEVHLLQSMNIEIS